MKLQLLWGNGLLFIKIIIITVVVVVSVPILDLRQFNETDEEMQPIVRVMSFISHYLTYLIIGIG